MALLKTLAKYLKKSESFMRFKIVHGMESQIKIIKEVLKEV